MTRAMTPAELERRHVELQTLQRNVAAEIVAVQDMLRAIGRWGRAGRPRRPPTHTAAEATDCHARYRAGERTPWVEEGRKQYERDRRRRAYAESKAAQ